MDAGVVDTEVCKVGDLQDGQMREVEIDGGAKILLVKTKGVYHAVGAKCTHFGASLSKGVLCGNHVRCPWHGACFNVVTGDIEDFPGLDSIPSFNVITVDGKVKIRARRDLLAKTRRPNTMVTSPIPQPNVKLVIIGGGPSATLCAMTAREEGFKGSVILLCKEPHIPYDRSKLSKALSSTAEQLALRDSSFYDNFNIECRRSSEVTGVDVNKRKITLKNGDVVDYNKLVIATGSTPRTLNVPGCNLENIVSLRTVDDAQFISRLTERRNVVIAGASFIGIEVAVSVIAKAKSVTVVGLVDTPFQAGLGRKIGDVVKQLLDEKGVRFQFRTTIKSFKGINGRLTEVHLTNGSVLQADLCVLGIGVVPETSFLKDSGIRLSERGHITVNKRMETNKESVYAIGDVVEFPLFIVEDRLANIQHWQMAHQHGRICGLNIAGKTTDIRSVPYFWTVICGKSLRYCGYGIGYDDVIVHGNLQKLTFAAFYTKGEYVSAVATMNMDPVASQAAELFLHGHKLTKTEVQKDAVEWTKKLQQLSSTLEKTSM